AAEAARGAGVELRGVGRREGAAGVSVGALADAGGRGGDGGVPGVGAGGERHGPDDQRRWRVRHALVTLPPLLSKRHGCHVVDQQKRPSVYLLERCQELGRVLDFFLAPHQGQTPGLDERLVVFLSQIGFWEWELDNLVYAFTSFAERARAWEHESGVGIANELRGRGILIRLTAVKGFKARRQARAERVRRVVAPAQELNVVIDLWNRLLDACEARVLAPAEERQGAVGAGAQVLPDLSRCRKEPLPAEEVLA